MTTFQTIKSIAFTLLPIAIPYLISTYRKYSSNFTTHTARRKPIPRRISWALNILFAAASLHIIASFYAFSYENLILDTESRLQTPQNVLWERVAARRPEKTLTVLDEKLKDRLASTDGRCLYLMYGGDTVGNCPFCNTDDARSYFYYALPEIFTPHVLNMVALGLATSAGIAGREGSRFRTLATVIGCILALVEVTAWWQYDWKANARVLRPGDMWQFYGWVRLGRCLGLAVADIGFAGLLWATSSNRIMVVPPRAEERIDEVMRLLGASGGKMTAAGIVRNVVARDSSLKGKSGEWFEEESRRMDRITADEEVKASIAQAKAQGRIDIDKLKPDAERYAEGLVANAPT